jgi:hypothetical protein
MTEMMRRPAKPAASWTVFYWSWWIAWCPYVGLFVARISRGRTIREFILGTVVVPSAVTMLWFAVFGGTAIHLDQTGAGDMAERVTADPAVGMFVFLEQYPLAFVMSILTLVILWIFFVAGADAGTIVLGGMSTGGVQDPKRWIKLLWGLAMAAIAGILLVVGSLGALQSASVLTGLPFAFIMVVMCVAFYKHLTTQDRREDQEGRDSAERAMEESAGRPAPRRPAPGQAFTAEEPAQGPKQTAPARGGGAVISRPARRIFPWWLAEDRPVHCRVRGLRRAGGPRPHHHRGTGGRLRHRRERGDLQRSRRRDCSFFANTSAAGTQAFAWVLSRSSCQGS